MNPDPHISGPWSQLSPPLPPIGPEAKDSPSVGKFLGFTLAIFLNALLCFLAFGFGHGTMNPEARGESFDLLAAMATIGAAFVGPMVSLLWIVFANFKTPSFREATLLIPLLYVPAIAWGLGMIAGVMLR